MNIEINKKEDEKKRKVYEYACEKCDNGFPRSVKETPQETCDMCGSEQWRFSHSRKQNI